jgi:cytochrome c556
MRAPLLLAAALMSLSGLAYSQIPPTAAAIGPVTPAEIIAARQGGQAMLPGQVAGMKAAVDAGADVKPFAAAARAMDKWDQAFVTLFPPGTETGGNTKAKPEIWSDRAGFLKAAQNHQTALQTLATAADANDKPAFATAFRDMTATCGACHRGYLAR